MDVNKCVKLHNEIFMHGWLRSGKTNEDFERDCKTWFNYFGEEAEALRLQNTLSIDLIAFLERAYVTNLDHSFFYYVDGLEPPSRLFEAAEVFNVLYSNNDPTRYVVLYAMNMFGSHPVGLIFDQKHHTAIICVDVNDSGCVCNGRMEWYPLERVLEAWLDMIEKGKAIVTRTHGDSEDPPWKLVSYSETILQETIDVFNCLVEEIESRLPGHNDNPPITTSPLIEDAVLESVNWRGFAYHFARKAKRPVFRYIAPGLEIPTTSIATEQPFNTENGENPPILLFRGTDGAAPCIVPELEDDSPFDGPFEKVSNFPAGLYLSCTDPMYKDAFEDECKLVLPFGVGARGYARKSDGSRFGENTEDIVIDAHDKFADVYQPGHQPFTEMHGCRLYSVLNNWVRMVRRGDWKISADGVMGGIEEWKKADTEELWDKYVLPVTW